MILTTAMIFHNDMKNDVCMITFFPLVLTNIICDELKQVKNKEELELKGKKAPDRNILQFF